MQARDDLRPEFLDDLPTERSLPRYGIVRTPARKKTPYLILSERALVMPTHWSMKRTKPCAGEDVCQECKVGTEKRWKVYLAVCTPASGLIEVLELTDRGGQPVLEFQKKNGSIRGRKITVWREGVKDNSPVAALVAPVMDPTIAVPPCPDVREFLYRMWYIKDDADDRPLFEVPCVVARGVPVVVGEHVPAVNGNGKHRLKKGG